MPVPGAHWASALAMLLPSCLQYQQAKETVQLFPLRMRATLVAAAAVTASIEVALRWAMPAVLTSLVVPFGLPVPITLATTVRTLVYFVMANELWQLVSGLLLSVVKLTFAKVGATDYCSS